MTNQLRKLVHTLVACLFLSSSHIVSAADSGSVSGQSPPLQGKTAAYGVLSEQMQARMGFKCATEDNEDVVVSDVVPGTAASDCEIHKGDLILDAQVVGTALSITIERDGRIFEARLREVSQTSPSFIVQKGKMDNRTTKPFTLNAEQKVIQDNHLVPEAATADKTPKLSDLSTNRFALQADQNIRMLADYNLELIVDRSMSMHKPDCPNGLSRWQWCGSQATRLAQALTPYVPNGLTIIPFATEYDVFEHANPQSIEYLFNRMNLQSGTRLFEPLTERLDNYFSHRKPTTKPLLVVVITDGVPVPKFEPELVKRELVEASKKMTSPGEVTVIFCQIGSEDRFGQRYLTELDDNLTNYGARYHFVHTISFDDLQQMGLGPALVASMKIYAPPPPTQMAKARTHQAAQFTK